MPRERVVERVDAKLRPGAVFRLAHRRHHPLVHVGQEGVVDLHIKAGIDDRLVFLVQAVGEREKQAPARRRRCSFLAPGRALAGATTGRNAPLALAFAAAALSVAMSRFTVASL